MKLLNVIFWVMFIINNPKISSCSNSDHDEIKNSKRHLYEVADPKSLNRPKVFILGSQHEMPLEFVDLEVQNLVKECDVLGIECNQHQLGVFTDSTVEELRANKLMSDNFKEWSEQLTIQEKKFLEDELQPILSKFWGTSYKDLNPSIIYSIIVDAQESIESFNGMDHALKCYFEHKKKPVIFLETSKDRLEALNVYENCLNTSLEDDIEVIKSFIQILTDKPHSQSSNEDVKSLDDFKPYFGQGNCVPCNAEIREIAISRNKSWITHIENYLQKYANKSICFVVGLGHLEDEDYSIYHDSVLTLLQNKGYIVKPL